MKGTGKKEPINVPGEKSILRRQKNWLADVMYFSVLTVWQVLLRSCDLNPGSFSGPLSQYYLPYFIYFTCGFSHEDFKSQFAEFSRRGN